MTAGRVDAVIAAVERHDAELANGMRVAADGLTAGEGEERISQSSLQAFLWYELPRTYPHDAWRPVAEAAGVLLALLGLDRYAAIARSSTTTAVLDAWENASAKGFARFRAANTASGVKPPDTELLAWGEVFGMAEAAALQSVEVALERDRGRRLPARQGFVATGGHRGLRSSPHSPLWRCRRGRCRASR